MLGAARGALLGLAARRAAGGMCACSPAASQTSPASWQTLAVRSLATAKASPKGKGKGKGKASKPALDVASMGKEELQSYLDGVRSRIFGTHIGNGLRSGRKVLRRALAGEKLASYYPQCSGLMVQKYDPMFQDPEIERSKMKVERLRRRGKGAPKKGEGKRATKGKKR